MLITNISLMGWLHSLACIVALVAGTWVMVARKGTINHRRWGWWYAGAMVTQAVTIMAVYSRDLRWGKPPVMAPHTFGVFHWMAVASLLAVVLAIFAATRQRRSTGWAHVHAQTMLFSYYLLVGGLINELLVRLLPLRHLAMALSPHAANPSVTVIGNSAQAACMMIWLSLALWFYFKVARERAPRPLTIGYPMRYSGGIFVALIGAGIFASALMGIKGWLVLAGAVLGVIAARRGARLAAPIWGRPSLAQIRVMVLAVGMEATLFAMLGSSGVFHNATQAWEILLAVVGFHFFIMRFSHGPIIVGLGAAVLAWIGIGAFWMHFSLPVLMAGDGVLKIGFGAWMAWPLLRAVTGQSAPVYPQASSPVPATLAE